MKIPYYICNQTNKDMVKNFHYRFLLVVTFIIGFLFICSVPEASDSIAWLFMGGLFFFLYWVSYKSFKNLPQERINEILFVDWFKKIGIDINED